ncbi:hypothetical protein [Pseudodesulfovibrio sediminis]|uniref:Uncharacterized protein n=1 Tax=Pseudodesulfovibrio sediminis TaxID=2810563 RepID=A0ABN6ETA4_9BACT|nr:hypothetical protein [Pseudodesulfovibrio sediminis]BCS88465.1 hypothetical protein PSDVSF_17070 [Pseudodesulfovibrio sediminis]
MSDADLNRASALFLLSELLSEPLPTEERSDYILSILDKIIPDPNYMEYIYYSDDFVNKDGIFDYEGLIKKCFDDYEPNIIAL